MKYFLVALSLALASGLTYAETEPAAGESVRGTHRGGPPSWMDELGVTDEQKEEMRKIRDAGGSREDMSAVLTPEQREQLKSAKYAPGRKGGKPIHIKDNLDLSEEQAAEMRRIRDEGGSRADMLQVLNDEQRSKLRESWRQRGTPRP